MWASVGDINPVTSDKAVFDFLWSLDLERKRSSVGLLGVVWVWVCSVKGVRGEFGLADPFKNPLVPLPCLAPVEEIVAPAWFELCLPWGQLDMWVCFNFTLLQIALGFFSLQSHLKSTDVKSGFGEFKALGFGRFAVKKALGCSTSEFWLCGFIRWDQSAEKDPSTHPWSAHKPELEWALESKGQNFPVCLVLIQSQESWKALEDSGKGVWLQWSETI